MSSSSVWNSAIRLATSNLNRFSPNSSCSCAEAGNSFLHSQHQHVFPVSTHDAIDTAPSKSGTVPMDMRKRRCSLTEGFHNCICLPCATPSSITTTTCHSDAGIMFACVGFFKVVCGASCTQLTLCPCRMLVAGQMHVP